MAETEVVHREKGVKAFFLLSSLFCLPCVDLNDLTAITAKQTVGRGEQQLYFWASAPTDAAVSRKDILQPMACHFHAAEWEVACKCLATSTDCAFFSFDLKVCLLVRSTPSIWLPTSSCRSCSMAFEFCFFSKLFFWVNTCWVLTASWQNTFLKSCCKDDGPPDGNRRGAQRPGRGVMYVFC